MPTNPQYQTDAEILADYNARANNNSNIQASLESNNKTPKPLTNELFKLLYGNENILTAVEKETVVNQFFADLFNADYLTWKINHKDIRSPQLEFLLKKYLGKTDFALKLWQTKAKAGKYGKYALVIIKELVGQDEKGFKISKPNLVPVKVNYKNCVNENIFEIEVEFEGYNFANGKDLYTLKRHYSILNNKVSVDKFLIDTKKQKIDPKELNESIKNNVNLASEAFDWSFIPVAVLKNNTDEIPRIRSVSSQMSMMANFDEHLAILPAWEKGSINFNGTPVIAPNQEQQNLEFIKDVLTKGFVQFRPVNTDSDPLDLSQNMVIFKPNSIMQTVKATRDLIWLEAKEDLGLPSLNEVKSAQKTTPEVMAKQFLTSPIIEREKMMMKSFLKDLAKKFLAILSECQIEDEFPKDFDLNKLEIDLDFDLTTEKNINETINKMTTNSPETIVSENGEPKGEIANEPKPSLWRWIINWFKK